MGEIEPQQVLEKQYAFKSLTDHWGTASLFVWKNIILKNVQKKNPFFTLKFVV